MIDSRNTLYASLGDRFADFDASVRVAVYESLKALGDDIVLLEWHNKNICQASDRRDLKLAA